MDNDKKHLLGYDLEELKLYLKEWREPEYHAAQIFSWVYQKRVFDFAKMSNLAGPFRKKLAERFTLLTFKPKERVESRDGTQKLLFELEDGSLIEAVIIPAEGRVTGCISTQAGCKFACKFCASGIPGFKRNLTAGEIIEEVLYLKENAPGKILTHLVCMGTGEPLDNYDNVLKAIRIINAKESLNIGARRITISTCGLVPGIARLAGEGLQIELSVSLHAADDATRSRLMPVNKKYPLAALMKACHEYVAKTNRQVTFEYILAQEVNSDLQSAKKLSILLHGLNCKVNIIPCNPVRELGIEPPNKLEILYFKDYLVKHGVNVTLRRPRGQDIDAACGQLRLRYVKE